MMASSYLTLYKIIILYLLDRAEIPLSSSQVMRFLLDREYTTFVTFQDALSQLTEQGLVKGEQDTHRTFLLLTPEGRESLTFFLDRLNPEIREQADAYLIQNRMKLRAEAAVRTDYTRRADGSYLAEMKILENGRQTFGLLMEVQTEADAIALCDRFRERNGEIYPYLIGKLMVPDEKS